MSEEPGSRGGDGVARAVEELRAEAATEWEQAEPRVASTVRRAYRRSSPLPTDLEWLSVSQHLLTGLVARAVDGVPGVRADDVRWTRPTTSTVGRVGLDLVGTFDLDLVTVTDDVRQAVSDLLAGTLGDGWEVDLTWVDLED